MKTLMFILIGIIIFGCKIPTAPEDTQYKSIMYELPYNQHLDRDAMFLCDNKIGGENYIDHIIFSVNNFDEDVYFGFYIMDGNDSLYFAPNLSTLMSEKYEIDIKEHTGGVINVYSYRYETYKKIDFKCEIFYR